MVLMEKRLSMADCGAGQFSEAPKASTHLRALFIADQPLNSDSDCRQLGGLIKI